MGVIEIVAQFNLIIVDLEQPLLSTISSDL
jgi:hypothetical protein